MQYLKILKYSIDLIRKKLTIVKSKMSQLFVVIKIM